MNLEVMKSSTYFHILAIFRKCCLNKKDVQIKKIEINSNSKANEYVICGRSQPK